MSTVLITGANRGIGLEFARQYSAADWQVVATCRTPERASDLAGLGVEIERLDVTDIGAMRALRDRLNGRTVDLLINNAGVYGSEAQRFGGIDVNEWSRVLLVDAIAPVKLTEVMIDNLTASPRPVVVNLTSKMGSIADNSSGGAYVYRSAKAALNAASRSLALDLRSHGVTVVALHPGWVMTDMGGPGALIPVEQSVTGMRRVIAGLSQADSGRFLGYDGAAIPW